MVERSLRASPEGIEAAKTAFIGLYPTQQKLADALEVTRQPISKFFNGKPVARDLFVRICEKLKLDWQAIAQKDDALHSLGNDNASFITCSTETIISYRIEAIQSVARQQQTSHRTKVRSHFPNNLSSSDPRLFRKVGDLTFHTSIF
jgi:transcriptional regulator with XRE-family HTH domain